MNSKRYFVFLVVLLSFFFPGRINAQRVPSDDLQFLLYVDSIYGADDKLVKGEVYIPTSSKIKGHPYLDINGWTSGDLFVKGKKFRNVGLMYNIVKDELILNAGLSNGGSVKLSLNKALIDSFYFDKRLFIKPSYLNISDSSQSFYEVLYDGTLSFIADYKKSFIRKYSDASPYGKFSSQTSRKFIVEKGKMVRISNKRSLLKYFTAQRKDIRRFMRSNRIPYRKAGHEQLHTLYKYIDSKRNGL